MVFECLSLIWNELTVDHEPQEKAAETPVVPCRTLSPGRRAVSCSPSGTSPEPSANALHTADRRCNESEKAPSMISCHRKKQYQQHQQELISKKKNVPFIL